MREEDFLKLGNSFRADRSRPSLSPHTNERGSARLYSHLISDHSVGRATTKERANIDNTQEGFLVCLFFDFAVLLSDRRSADE